MFVHDPALTELVFEYCRERLALDPVPLDFPGEKGVLDSVLAGAIDAGPHTAEHLLHLFETHMAPAVLSCDSPRFLAFIPAAPTKASLLFDMIVSASSLQGASWLEAAGAVVAENQALRVLADVAGMPPAAGGSSPATRPGPAGGPTRRAACASRCRIRPTPPSATRCASSTSAR
jgi:aromatic-L-amino-acid decarboxylase